MERAGSNPVPRTENMVIVRRPQKACVIRFFWHQQPPRCKVGLDLKNKIDLRSLEGATSGRLIQKITFHGNADAGRRPGDKGDFESRAGRRKIPRQNKKIYATNGH